MIASDITIEGKIEGAGTCACPGRFKGDVVIRTISRSKRRQAHGQRACERRRHRR
jgi:hypothetical protein